MMSCLEVQERLENLFSYYFIACKKRLLTGRVLEILNLVNCLFVGVWAKIIWIGVGLQKHSAILEDLCPKRQINVSSVYAILIRNILN